MSRSTPEGQALLGVTEYAEGMPVYLCQKDGTLIIRALNEAGYNCTEVDLVQLLRWLVIHDRPLIQAMLEDSKEVK